MYIYTGRAQLPPKAVHLATYLPSPRCLLHTYRAAVPPYHGAPQHDTKHTMDTSCGTPWNTSTADVPRERSIHILSSSASFYPYLSRCSYTSFTATPSPFLPHLPIHLLVRSSVRSSVFLASYPVPVFVTIFSFPPLRFLSSVREDERGLVEVPLFSSASSALSGPRSTDRR